MQQDIKDLVGNDIFLNLKEIQIWSQNGISSRFAPVSADFCFECETKYGYMEDPQLGETMLKILKVTKNSDGTFTFKVKVEKRNEGIEDE